MKSDTTRVVFAGSMLMRKVVSSNLRSLRLAKTLRLWVRRPSNVSTLVRALTWLNHLSATAGVSGKAPVAASKSERVKDDSAPTSKRKPSPESYPTRADPATRAKPSDSRFGKRASIAGIR